MDTKATRRQYLEALYDAIKQLLGHVNEFEIYPCSDYINIIVDADACSNTIELKCYNSAISFTLDGVQEDASKLYAQIKRASSTDKFGGNNE